MAKAPVKKTPPPKRRWLPILLTSVLAAFLMSIGVGAGLIYMKLTKPTDELPLSIVIYKSPYEQTYIASDVSRQDIYRSSYYEIVDPITTNLLYSIHICQVRVALGTTYDHSFWAIVQPHQLAIRSAIFDVMAAATDSDIRSDEGKRALFVKIRDAVNNVLLTKQVFPGVESVHFVSVYVQ